MKLSLDMTRVIDFLVELLNVPSPTGYHDEANTYLERSLDALGLPGMQMHETTKGALVATLPGVDDTAPRAVSAHVDTLGAMVREIKGSGRLMLAQLGGYAWNAIESENVTIHSVCSGARYRGTVQTVNPSVHTGGEMKEGKRDDDRMEVRLDARVRNREETLALGISVGDLVFLDPRVELTDTGYIKSRHLDDKAGVAAAYGALLMIAEGKLTPAQRTTFFFSNYEEAGHGAAAGIPADVVELLVIDMAAATSGEHQNSDEYSVGICAKDRSGPYDLAVRRKLTSLAAAHDIPYKVDTYPRYGSDGSSFLAAGGCVRVGLIGPGVDASHAYERTHRESIEATARLTLHYLLAED